MAENIVARASGFRLSIFKDYLRTLATLTFLFFSEFMGVEIADFEVFPILNRLYTENYKLREELLWLLLRTI